MSKNQKEESLDSLESLWMLSASRLALFYNVIYSIIMGIFWMAQDVVKKKMVDTRCSIFSLDHPVDAIRIRAIVKNNKRS